MRKELFLHFAFWAAFFLFITLIRQYFDLSYWPFWVGGFVGVFLPDIDHLIYVYFVQPQELTSQRVGYLVNKKELKRSVELLYETRSERRGLIFHTLLFQIIFFVLTFWVMSSSGSLFGQGLVLSFALHLSVDQIVDLTEVGNLNNWFKDLPFSLDPKQSRTYWIVTTIMVLLFGFFL